MKEMKYEDAVKKLTEIMEKLESGEIALDKTFEMYEEGKKLIEFCRKQLTEAEGKIMKVSKNGIDEIN
ncbi:MAG: exodeoxyribonuclease VII small subunit [Candidatus Delongbacteria bacterium]|nr:exodeoxyribonuclease VII small subunit [Candidatus Delongbacteria bacterium]MCG2760088.1 exodeoxyribonuclease VII small subunit [Candidatus Delongbacteria bacterium]